ncbi:MAG: tetratricopeptide repeat protein, partial [Planctomycetes bacterium]|nr:tetratricopeptide repeat protein [Planctomycetota bacterium]
DADDKIKDLSAIYRDGEKSTKVREKIQELTGAVAETAFEDALALQAQGKTDEALAKLDTLVKEFPNTDWAKKAQAKSAEIKAARAPDPSVTAFKAAEALAAQKSHAQAFGAWRAFLAEHGNSSQADAARAKTREALVAWTRHVTSESATRPELEEFLSAAEKAKPTEWAGAFQEKAPDALLRLSQRLAAEGKPEDAAAVRARLAREHPDSPAAEKARDAMEAERKALEAPSRVVDEFAAGKLDASLWSETGAAGAVRVQGGELALVGECTETGKWERGVATRTFTVASCEATLALRVPALEARGSASSAEIVFALSDSAGSSFRVTFNGKWYGRGLATAGKGKALTKAQIGQVKPAFGDEAEKPHALTIRYDLGAQRATGLLDGQELGTWPLKLQDILFAFQVAGSGPFVFDIRVADFRCEFSR